MENNKLTTQEKLDTVPLKALPSDEIYNKKILKLGVWLDGVLSLDGEKSVKRLEVLLPMIKESYARTYSIHEIQKAFMMYVKGELDGIEPRDNYLTVILFNKVLNQYREQAYQRPKTQKKSNEELKADQDFLDAVSHYDYFLERDKLDENCAWVYTYLTSKGVIGDCDEDKRIAFNSAVEKKGYDALKLSKDEKEECVLLAKEMLLLKHFQDMKESKLNFENHLKTQLKHDTTRTQE